MTTAPPDGQVTTRVVQDETEWDAIREEWNTLWAASPTASTPLDFSWLRAWWRVYKSAFRAAELRVVTIWRGTQLIGAIPLYVHRGQGGPLGIRRLGFISTGEEQAEETCPDYLNLLFLPGEDAVCVDSVWRIIEQMEWDRLELLDLPEDTPLLRSSGRPAGAQRFSRGACPVADLTGGFEAYIASLSMKLRRNARKYLRETERDGGALELATEASVDQFFDDLVRLHQKRWTAEGKPGVFAAPRFTEFHRGLAREGIASGRTVLARLSHGGQVYAALYGFITGSKFDAYQSGIGLENAGPFESPGTTVHLLLMRVLAERGVTAYDFLRGSSTYKVRHATREDPLVGISMWRPNLRSAVYRTTHLGGRIVRKAFRVMRHATS